MDFVNDGPVLALVSAASLTVFALVMTILIGSIHKKTKKQTYILIGSSVGLGVLATILFIILGNTPGSSEVYTANIKSLYGLDASERQLKELEFPKQEPGDERKFYGTTTLVGEEGSEVQTLDVVLGWDGEKFLLYSTGEENTVTPLPFKG